MSDPLNQSPHAGTEAVPGGTPVAGTGVAKLSSAPATMRNVPHRGGEENPSVEALRHQFGADVLRSEVVWGESSVFVENRTVHAIIRWLRDEPAHRYDYLVDVTAVEHRDFQRPLEVVWHLRSLTHRRFLRLKVALEKRATLRVPSIVDLYSGADWLERECYDMFGIEFEGHPDLRRILLWETYREGYPLRKDFPLRGRFSRAEQLKQALAAEPEARYSMQELSIAEAFDSLPLDMRERLAAEQSAAARGAGPTTGASVGSAPRTAEDA